eukprot:548422-Prymnesium_polylepis.1
MRERPPPHPKRAGHLLKADAPAWRDAPATVHAPPPACHRPHAVSRMPPPARAARRRMARP